MRRISGPAEAGPPLNGSPSQRIASLSPLPAATCRSRQLYERFVRPPTNHFAYGGVHSSTLSHFLNQCSSLAASPQKRSGSSIDARYIRRYSSIDLTCAAALNAGGGGKTRCSWR